MRQFASIVNAAVWSLICVGAAQAQDLRVTHKLVADDYFLRPGETTKIYLWVEHAPGLSEPIVFKQGNKSYNATVASHAQSGGGLTFDRQWGDGFTIDGLVFNAPEYAVCSDCTQVLNNGYAFGPIYLNKCFSSSCFLWPPVNNPKWGCYFHLSPLNYESKTISFSFSSNSKALMALEVPELYKWYPNFQYMLWPASDSPPITIEIGPACIADCESDGTLNIDDFVCFMTSYALADLTKADCDGDGVLTIDDFICFQTAFVLGC